MSLRFSLTDGKTLPVQPGLTRQYSGKVLDGSNAYHIKGEFGYAAIQEVRFNNITFNKVVINWKKPQRLICEHNYPPVVFCRTVLNKGLYEVIKGSGDRLIHKEQFVAHTGKKWSELKISEKSGEHHFIDMSWSAEFLNEIVVGNTLPVNNAESYNNGIVNRLTSVPHDLNVQMNRIIEDIQSLDFNSSSQKQSFFTLMLKYLSLMSQEIKEQHSIRKNISKSDWYNINQVKQMIDENLDKRISTPELSKRSGVNEFKIKSLFPKLTGYAVDEYRKNKLFINSARRIIQNPDIPSKIVAMEAGYNSLTTFIRAFKNSCHCTPGELKTDSWDVSRIRARMPELNEII